MKYEEKWEILSDFLIELQENGEKIPNDIIKDLRTAKTIIQVLKADPSNKDNISRVDKYLRNVESYTICTADKKDKVDATIWLNKLDPQKKIIEKTKKSKSKFISGIPKNKSWIRIEIIKETPLNELKEYAKKLNLSFKIQGKNNLLVFGEKNSLKSYIKLVSEQFSTLNKDESYL